MSLKIAVIGCGWVSMDCHGPAYAEYAASHPAVSLAACCDVDSERAERFRARFGFKRAYSNAMEMLDSERPQAVCLNVPPHLTTDLGCAVMQRGIALLAEKPPGLSLAEIDRLIETARSSGVIHQVAFNRRFMPLVAELGRRLAGQKVHHLEVQLARVRRTDPVFATTAVHAVDAARFLTGCDYAHLRLTYQELPDLGPGVANYAVHGSFANRASVHLGIFPVAGVSVEHIQALALDHTYTLDATNAPEAPGRLRHFFNGHLIEEVDAVQFTQRRESYYLNGFYHQDASFFDALQAGVQPVHDFQSCRQSIEIMQAMVERQETLSWPAKESTSPG